MEYPVLCRIHQRMDEARIADVPSEVIRQFDGIGLRERIRPGMEIAVTAGSRGIANLAAITRAVCDYVKACEGVPFIVPSMGSHGGATAKGQAQLLAKYGITREAMHCDIRSSMDAELLGRAANGAPVYMDRHALHADGIISVNRVKPHTDFFGQNESGIVKMIAVGLGKEKGATAMHAWNLGETIPLAFAVALEKAPILAGLAIVENARDETAILRGVLPADFLRVDSELLQQAYRMMPRLPADRADLLVVREMGKAYSGTGMDTKVIGRIRVPGVAEPEAPHIGKLVVLRLAASSGGNALGVGLADITTQALVNDMDTRTTWSNLIPTTYLDRGKIPVYLPTEEAAIRTGFLTLGASGPEKAKVMVIDNTLHLETMLVSENMLGDLHGVDVLERGIRWSFDAEGNLTV